jgi:hypothetical protein
MQAVLGETYRAPGIAPLRLTRAGPGDEVAVIGLASEVQRALEQRGSSTLVAGVLA